MGGAERYGVVKGIPSLADWGVFFGGERLKLPSGVWDKAPTANDFYAFSGSFCAPQNM